MEFGSLLVDRKIMGVNIGADLSVDEYISFADGILERNEFQRRRVKGSGRTYELLRKDLVQGCVIPPIILAVTERYGDDLSEVVKRVLDQGTTDADRDQLEEFVLHAASDGELLILDGLQRTLTIRDVLTKSEGEFTDEQLENFRNQKIRIEVYLGLSKPGILYRMLTLNTGQTPMSFRHQLEILYADYIDHKDLPDNIAVVREIDDKRARGLGRYKFSDVVDMFYAYSTGTPMPYDRQALVGELREMKFLEQYRFTQGKDDMKSLLEHFNRLVARIDDQSDGWSFDNDFSPGVERPFGNSVVSILARSQPMSGFGAECKRLLEKGSISTLHDLGDRISGLHFSGHPNEALSQLITILDHIGKRAKRIGDAQRVYFQLAFRALLLPENNTYQDLSGCWLAAQETYELQYG